jgi:hypothetical protein
VRRLLAALAWSAMVLSAADLSGTALSGTWMGSITTGRRNTVVDFAFRFEQKGAALTGKAYFDYGAVPILKGVIEGDKLSFEIVAREQNGNEISESVFKFTGTMKDGEIELTRERLEMRNSVNAAAAFVKQSTPLTFKVKRLP